MPPFHMPPESSAALIGLFLIWAIIAIAAICTQDPK